MKEEDAGKYPEGHFLGKWMGIAMIIFAGGGIALGIALKHTWVISLGPAIGAAFGLAIGSAVEARMKKAGKVRPLTEEERTRRKYLVWGGVAMFLIGLLVFLWYSFK